jgi:ABC-type antimicrobial peptide transport system permease subunit
VRAIDPQVPVSPLRSFDEIVAGTLRGQRFNATLFAAFGAAALLLAAVGIYGVLAATVARRRREVGVRLALGALPAQAARLVVARAAAAVALGALGGFAAAGLAARGFSGLLGAIPWWDPASAGVAAFVLVVVVAAAALVPARRAARLDPAVVLREE